MKKRHGLMGMFSVVLALCLAFTGCGNTITGDNSANTGNNSGNSGNNTGNTGDNTGNSNNNNNNGAGGNNGTPVIAIPGVPGGLTATALSSSEIIVSWAAVAGATTYEVSDGTKTYATALPYITVSGLQANTSYQFTVKAGNAVGWGGASSPATGQTLGDGISIPPDVPAGVTAGALSSTEIRVSWGTVSGAASYMVYYGTESAGNSQYGGMANTSPLTITGLQPETAYAFTVKAGNGNGWSEGSTPVGGTTQAAPSYAVTYSANGASGSVPAPQTAVSDAGITIAGPDGLTNSGKTFSGWNTSADGTGTTYAAGSSLTVTANSTLYAQWITIPVTSYTIRYNANDGSGSAPAAQTAASGVSVYIAGQGGLSFTGKTFNGWNTNADGTGISYGAGSSLELTGNVTLHAQWITVKPPTYTVTYNANGGIGKLPEPQTGTYNENVTVADQGDLSYAGKTFNGWNTSFDGKLISNSKFA